MLNMNLPKLCGFLFLILATAPGAAQENGIEVAALLGLTGDSAQFGKGELDAITLAAEKWNRRGGINGRKIKLEVENTATSPMQVVSGYKKLTDLDKHQVILGPTWLDTFQAVIPLAEKKRVLLLTPSAEGLALKHSNPKDLMALTTYYSSSREVAALLQALQADGVRTVMGTYTQEPFFLLLRELVEKDAAKYGIRILESDNFDFGYSDFHSFMARARQKRPDCLLLFQTEEGTVLGFLRARKQHFPEVKVAGIHDFQGFFRKDGIRNLAGSFYYTHFLPADPPFVREFKDRFGYEPMLTHSNAYDAANMLFEALAAGKSTGPEIRDYLMSRRFKTVTFGDAGFTREGAIDKTEARVQKLP